MKEVIAISFNGKGEKHEHIEYFKYKDSKTREVKTIHRDIMITLVETNPNTFYVKDTKSDKDKYVEVKIVKANPPYLRTEKNGIPTDNLLALPIINIHH